MDGIATDSLPCHTHPPVTIPYTHYPFQSPADEATHDMI